MIQFTDHDMQKIFGITRPWQISQVCLNEEEDVVEIHVTHTEEVLRCPHCQARSPIYDKRVRKWRDTDIRDRKACIIASVPRVECKEHGIHTIQVPWAEGSSRYTMLFEQKVIDLLKECSKSAVARQFSLSWDAIDRIMKQAVERGLGRRERTVYQHLNVDEVASKKGHNYLTIVSSPGQGVLFVGEGRAKNSLDQFYQSLDQEQLDSIVSVSMDMWPAFIRSTKDHVPDADSKTAFDKYHVAQHCSKAVNKVRKQEHKKLTEAGIDTLKKTKFLWLTSPANRTQKMEEKIERARKVAIKTARATAIKDLAMSIWNFDDYETGQSQWKKWLSWAMRSRLEPVKEVAQMVKKHLYGILNAGCLGVTNAAAESLNSQIKMVKVKSRGFRNLQNLTTSIYFHLGQLDLSHHGSVTSPQ